MLKTISSSNLRTQVKTVLNEVSYSQGVHYIVQKFGEPTAAIISMEDFRFLQAAKQQQATASLREVTAGIQARTRQLDPDELDALIEEARAEFHHLRSH